MWSTDKHFPLLLWAFCALVNEVFSQEEVEKQQTDKNIAVRLRGGNEATEGRVEIAYHGKWGTICDDDWNMEAATVICRMIGYEGARDFVHSGGFGPGEGTIWLDNVQCTGEEQSIADCSLRDWGDHDCTHHEDAGVKCLPTRIPDFLLNSKNLITGLDVIRLKPAKGQRKYIPQFEGFVEIQHENKWTKICSHGWSDEVATVICGQLGFPQGGRIPQLQNYLAKAKRKHNYWVINATCKGIESRLNECSFNTLPKATYKGCRGGHPLLVRCGLGYHQISRNGKKYKNDGHPGSPGLKIPTDIRLKAGALGGEGRLEIMRSGRWGTVCHRDFSILAANVACRQLGLGTAKRQLRDAFFGQGHGPIWMSHVRCVGNESHLTQCRHINLSTSYNGYEEPETRVCSHQEDVGVSCHTPDLKSKTRIRLVGGRNPMEGRVEVRVRRKWGPICSDGWTAKEAMVVCRQLGLGFALHALTVRISA